MLEALVWVAVTLCGLAIGAVLLSLLCGALAWQPFQRSPHVLSPAEDRACCRHGNGPDCAECEAAQYRAGFKALLDENDAMRRARAVSELSGRAKQIAIRKRARQRRRSARA